MQNGKNHTGETMIIPIRCWSCGKPLAQLWNKYQEGKKEGIEIKKILDDIGLERYCCRSIMMGHVDLTEVTSRFRKT